MFYIYLHEKAHLLSALHPCFPGFLGVSALWLVFG